MIAPNRSSSARLALATLLSAALVACGGAGNPGPAVASMVPPDAATDVTANSAVVASFRNQIDPATINATTFIVKQGPSRIAGAVSAAGVTASFQPSEPLAPGRQFTASLTGAKYLAGNGAVTPLVWTFTTAGVRVGLAPVLLGTAGNFAILAQTAMTNVPTSAITGDIAISPAAESYLAGFAQTDATGYATAPQVVGRIFAADQAAPTPGNLTAAVGDMGTAYTDAAGRPTPDFLELGTGAIGGLTLAPGLYKWTSGVTISADVTLAGNASDVWIFQTTGTLIQSAGTKVLLSGGAQAKNVFWQVADAVTLGTTAHFEGIILAQTAIALQTGATLHGRALAQTAVTLDQNTVTQPVPGADSTPPTVLSVSPVAKAAGVATAATASATFSKAMTAATLAGGFTLAAGGHPIAGTVTYAETTATFHPAAALPANTPVTATIAAGVKDLAGNALVASYAWTFTTGAVPDTTPPAVLSASPAGGATDVASSASISATFNEPMAASTLTAATFTVAAGGQAIAGSVAYAGNTATFQPAAALPAGTVVAASITAGARDLEGNGLAASYQWSFTTAALPAVTATSPGAHATGVAAYAAVVATFNKSIDPRTLTAATFTVSAPGGAAVAGAVSSSSLDRTATFRAAGAFAASTLFTARVAGGPSGVADLAGNRMARDFTWTFTSAAAHSSPAPVLLGTSGNYVILAETAITNVPTSRITGDVAISPAAESYVAGFTLTDATGYATATEVVGKVYAADQAAPTPINLTTAVKDMGTAYTDAATRPSPDFLELGTGAIGGMTLQPGLYKWAGTVGISSDLTLTGGANDVWIFQIAGDLALSGSTKVFLSGGALAKNVFWQVAGQATLGTTSHFEGILLSQTAINLRTAASMTGRALAQAAVVLDSNAVTQPAP